MTVEIIKGDLLDALDRGDINVACHVVNCQGVMGSGIAKTIKERYPMVFKRYSDTVDHYTKIFDQETSNMLGAAQLVSLDGGGNIGNLYAQDYYGTDKRHLNYGAFSKSLIKLKLKIDNQFYDAGSTRNIIIGFPYKIGSDRAGGDWEIVKEIIEFVFKHDVVKIYQLEK